MGTTPRYPTYSEIRERRLAARRAIARRVLEDMEALVRGEGGRLVVFGSLAEGGFGDGSDVDVAVFGVPGGRDEAVAARIDEALAAAGFAADVVTERYLTPSLRQRILDHGRAPGALG